MKILRHPDLKKDLKKLKKYNAPVESLESWELLFEVKGLENTPSIDKCKGYGSDCNIYKARIIPLKENFGKSNGYRVIFCIKTKEESQICYILFFTRHGIYKKEDDLIKIVKERIMTSDL